MFHRGANLLLQVVVKVVEGEVLVLDLAEESCAHRDESSQNSVVPTVMSQMLLTAALPEKSHQVLPHSLLVHRSDNSRALVERELLGLPRNAFSCASTSARSRGT